MTAQGLQQEEGDEDLHGHGSHVAGLVAGDTFLYQRLTTIYLKDWSENIRFVGEG